MPLLVIVIGTALLILGGAGYVATGMVSWTALIPAFFGLPLVVLGWVAQKPAWRKHGMHAAAGVALLGLLGSLRGVPDAFTLMVGGEVDRPGAALSQALMAALCLVLVIVAIKSFIDARRRPTATS